ncbi:hypothetical protein [Nocardia sp. NPDC050175]|uniref:hypothetical protein n=1 Tax=Nocardia sp. NPDC050175 TaxID=3364317 RepID=UPI0037B606B1
MSSLRSALAASKSAETFCPLMNQPLETGHGQTYLDMSWEPKAAFTELAQAYQMT